MGISYSSMGPAIAKPNVDFLGNLAGRRLGQVLLPALSRSYNLILAAVCRPNRRVFGEFHMDSSSPGVRISRRRSEQLVADLQAGHSEALVTLLDVYRPYLLATAQARLDARLKAKAGPSDMVQETIVAAHQAWQEIEPRPLTADEFREWLRQLLLERLKALRRKYYRAQSRSLRRELPLDDGQSKRLIDALAAVDSDTPSVNLDRQTLSDQLESAIQRLPAAYRQVILWRNRDNWRFAEIGAKMDRSADAARMLWTRAIRLLRVELGARDGDL
jgi:RNA polymerase sigma-70 factor (ECF subfamily)